MFFIQFETFSDKFLAVCWELFGRFIAFAIYVFIRFLPTGKKFCLKFLFFIISYIDRKTIELRQSIFGGVVKTAFYVCIRTFWQKLLSLWGKDINFCRYRTFSGTFSEFYRKLSARFWKLQFTCPINSFEQKGFLWKLLRCFCLFRSLSKRYLTNCRESFVGVVKTAFWESMP